MILCLKTVLHSLFYYSACSTHQKLNIQVVWTPCIMYWLQKSACDAPPPPKKCLIQTKKGGGDPILKNSQLYLLKGGLKTPHACKISHVGSMQDARSCLVMQDLSRINLASKQDLA